MGEHLIDGEFQSDKYDWCKRGFAPLKLTDPMAQPLLWAYADERRAVDAEFADDLQEALRLKGYVPPHLCWLCGGEDPGITIAVRRETPGGLSCNAKEVRVHFECYMDMDA